MSDRTKSQLKSAQPVIWQAVCVVLLAAIVAGCGGPSRQRIRKTMRPPKQPPPVPAPVQTPIDQQLRAAARQELMSAASSDRAVVRAHAIEAMKESLGPEARDYILKGLQDPEALVRFAAAMAAGELRLAEAKPILLQLLDDADESVRVATLFALHRLGDPRRSHELEKTARALEPRTRADTALVLGLLEEPTAVRVLRPMRSDPNPAVRLQANEALWRLGDQQGQESLIAGTISGYPDDQMISLLALAAPRDQRVIGHIRPALTTDYEEVNLVAARAMGMLGSDAGHGVALRGVKSRDPRQRLLAALALGAIGRADAQDELTQLLKDSDQDVRLAAATAILQLKKGAQR